MPPAALPWRITQLQVTAQALLLLRSLCCCTELFLKEHACAYIGHTSSCAASLTGPCGYSLLLVDSALLDTALRPR